MKKLSRYTLCLLYALAAMFIDVQAFAASVPDAVMETISARTDEIFPRLVEIRRQLHMHPEVSGEEKETAALVAKRLKELGFDVRENVGGYGVVGVLEGAKPGPVVAYRADMDAVRSPVIGDQPYKSQVPGVKHVCGHDLHVAIGLGIAEVYASMVDELPGTIKLIFQPAEENLQGAFAMLADGALENPKPSLIYAVHVTPFEVGQVACPLGVGLASYLPIRIALEGDAELARSAAKRIADHLNAASTVSPVTSPADLEKVMTKLTEGESFGDFMWIFARPLNEPAAVEGFVRTPSDDVTEKAKALIADIAQDAGEGVTAKISNEGRYLPPMQSDPKLVTQARPVIERILGAGSTVPLETTIPYFGEDFSYFQREIPGAMFFVGVANESKGISALNHTPDYDADEEGIRIGVKSMAAVMYDALLNTP